LPGVVTTSDTFKKLPSPTKLPCFSEGFKRVMVTGLVLAATWMPVISAFS